MSTRTEISTFFRRITPHEGRVRRPQGRTPRPATNARPRGSRRSLSRSSSRGGDSGDDSSGSSEGDGEPAAARPLLYLIDPRLGRVNAAMARFLRGAR